MWWHAPATPEAEVGRSFSPGVEIKLGKIPPTYTYTDTHACASVIPLLEEGDRQILGAH